MTPNDAFHEEAPRRRGRWMIFLPFALLILLGIAWSGFWHVAAGKADEAIEAWLAREAAQGRVYACGTRQIVGYPFRIELICDKPTARLPGDGGPVVASAPRFMAVAQVYDPRRLIGELVGPVEMTDAAGRRADLSFAVAQASAAAGPDNRFARTSIALTAPRLTVEGAEIGAAQKLDVHVRRKPDGPDGVFDIAVKLDAGVSPLLDAVAVGEGPLAAEFQAEIRGVDDLRPMPTSERLKAFAEAGGQLHVALARLQRGAVAAEAKGDLALDVEGRPGGDLRVTARGLEDVVQALVGGEGGGKKKDLLGALLGAGAQMLGKEATLDDKPATAYRVRIDRGRVEIGPIRVWKFAPLF